uniref:leucine-rich repeat-containing protein 40-like n=1 Tax=Styela clava TaxID=7725 RepID=UPI00193A4038|nr:leucine-rich repeat-containing protein 40-like [Styela clava]
MSRFQRHLRQQAGASKENGSHESLSKSLFPQARKTGQLNLSNREYKEVPSEVWRLNSPPIEGDADFGSSSTERWWDQVPLTKLILASNALISLSEKISVFPALVVLDLHDNKLSQLPSVIGSLEVLEKLDVSHNELESLPSELSMLERLSTFLLHHNQISHLPDDIGQLSYLRVLNASHNKLQAIPRNLASMTDIQKLNFSNNQLESLPEEICQLSHLSYLDLNYNNLSYLPQNWRKMNSLKELYLRNNSLTSLPLLSNCSSLKELYCASNNMKHLEVNKLPESLVIVELRDNKISKIEEDIVALKDLQRLDLANNDVSTLPPRMGLMEHITALNVDGNPMRGLRRDIINRGTLAIIQYLRTRIVDKDANADSENGSAPQSSLPVSSAMAERSKLHTLTSTKSLDISNKVWSEKLLDGSEEIPLEVINMSKMGLSQFPSQICQFKSSLKSLNISLNKISVFGSEIGDFVSLTHLNLGTNLLTDLPVEMTKLKSLIELNIMQNRFSLLPESVYSMESLEHLLAGGNKIEKINMEGLKKLTKLSTLALQNNSIAQVPPELGLMSSLRNLQLEGNVFRIPRHTILQQGTQAVLDYLKGRVPTN